MVDDTAASPGRVISVQRWKTCRIEENVATDPVRRVRSIEQDASAVPDLPAALSRLAALSPQGNEPMLTVSVDLSIEGSDPGRIPPAAPKRSQERAMRHETGSPKRPGWQQMQRDLDALLASHEPRGEALDRLTADVARITAFVDNDLDPSARGLFVVASDRQEIFEPVVLDVPVPTSLVVESIPALRPLVHAAEDYPSYAVVNADQQEANIWLIERRTWSENVQVESNAYPRHQSSGGLNQQRYQRRADERVEAFARTVSEQLTRLFLESAAPPEYLILSSDEPMSSAISSQLHQEVAARVLGTLTLTANASAQDVASAAGPMVEAEERRQEREAVQQVRDGVGAQTLGIAGAVDTLRSLAAGQVRTLVMNDDFTSEGWADYTLPLFGIGPVPAEHPAGGDVANLVPTKLEDEAVRLALLNGGNVELIKTTEPISADEDVPRATDALPRTEAAQELDTLGGIGALLRYAVG